MHNSGRGWHCDLEKNSIIKNIERSEMSRKKKILEEKNSLEQKLRDLEEENKLLEEKRQEDTEKIKKFIEENFKEEYYCGTILDFNMVLDLLKLINSGNQVIRIPFNLYWNEE